MRASPRGMNTDRSSSSRIASPALTAPLLPVPTSATTVAAPSKVLSSPFSPKSRMSHLLLTFTSRDHPAPRLSSKSRHRCDLDLARYRQYSRRSPPLPSLFFSSTVGYHGYWAQDLFHINPYFGTSKDLKLLVAECHKRDIWVMVDVVANHMGPVGSSLLLFPVF